MSRKVVIFTGIGLGISALLAAYLLGFFDSETVEVDDWDEVVYTSQLTGAEVSKSEAEKPVLAVIIENSPAARPQTGLDAAGIVFEAPAEGGITRTLAFYQEDQPEEIGPIRSLRPYTVNWVSGFDASVAHVGGSGEALQQVQDYNLKSLDEIRHGGLYYRSQNRAAPHNVYARTQDLRDMQDEAGHEQSQFSEIPRRDDNPEAEASAENIIIDYSTREYTAEFRYRPEDNDYIRYLAGEPHVDAATGEQINVRNLVVIFTDINGGNIETIGGGEALVFNDGGVEEVNWQKSSRDERLKLVDREGNEAPLNVGDTWFAVLPPDRPLSY